MLFCKNLCYDINFEPASVQPCCDIHSLQVPQFPFTGGRLDMRAYAAHIQNIVNRLQDKADKICRGCPNLQELPDDRNFDIGMIFRTVSINMHRHLCNCKCVYCDLWRGKGEIYPILPVLKSLHEQEAMHPACFFSWGGGEPSILKDFDESSFWIKEQGWRQNVHTSCLRYSPAIASILQEDQGSINVSLDSGCRETYQKVKGLDGFDRVRKNLEHYMSGAKQPEAVRLKYIIFDLNNDAADIRKFFSVCSELGVKNVEYSLNFKEVNGAGPSPKTLLGAAYFQYMAQRLNMTSTPFFVSPQMRFIIEELRKEHFN